MQFDISQDGGAVGVASFDSEGTPDGYESNSMVRIEMQKLDYRLSTGERRTAAGQFRSALMNAVINGSAVSVVCAPKKAQIVVNFLVDGKSATTRLAAHEFMVFMPEFDPGALQSLLTLAAAQNNRDVWAILPRNTGAIEPVELKAYPDQQGRLDGQTIVVHHLAATIAGAQTDIFSGPDNQLLQAELPQKGFEMVRKGFVLSNKE